MATEKLKVGQQFMVFKLPTGNLFTMQRATTAIVDYPLERCAHMELVSANTDSKPVACLVVRKLN